MKLPDITPAQIKADVLFASGIAATLGFKLDGDLQTSIVAVLIAAFALVHTVTVLADTLLRRSRAQNADKLAAASPPPAATPTA